MASGVPIPGVEGRHERGCEREICSLKVLVDLGEIAREFPFGLIKHERPLRGQRRSEEKWKDPRRNGFVAQGQECDTRNVERKRRERERADLPHRREWAAVSP